MSKDINETSASLLPLAVVIFVLGLLALIPVLWIILGPVALLLGYLSLRRINKSDGQRRGVGFAWAGMVLGGIGAGTLGFCHEERLS